MPLAPLDRFDTALNPGETQKFQAWKAQYAPRDSGADYDLRGAFKAGVTPAVGGPNPGHFPDTWKKPNHPTFSDQSMYAKFGNPGHWEGPGGQTYVPGSKQNMPAVDPAKRKPIPLPRMPGAPLPSVTQPTMPLTRPGPVPQPTASNATPTQADIVAANNARGAIETEAELGRSNLQPPANGPSAALPRVGETQAASGAFTIDPATGKPYGPQGWSRGFQKLGQGLSRTASLFAGAPASPQGAPGVSLIPDAQARPVTMPQAAISTPTQPDLAGQYDAVRANLAAGATGEEAGRSARQGIPFSAPVGGTAVQGGNPLYENLQGPAVAPALASTDPGTAVISGRFAGSAAPETRSYTKAGVADAASRLNVVPGLFSGVSRETEQALGEARQAAEARGDYAAVERSYQSPEERAQADAAKAEGRLLKRLPGLPAAQVPAALTSLGGQRKPLTFDQFKAARAAQLGQGEPTAADKLLFGQRTPPLTQPRVYTRKSVDEAGTETNLPYTLDAQGNAVPVKFPAQAPPPPQVPPEHIAMLQANPTPEMQAYFEAQYQLPPGGAAQYIKK